MLARQRHCNNSCLSTDDDDIETSISIRCKDLSTERSGSPAPRDVIIYEPDVSGTSELADVTTHGKTTDGEIACCAITSTGIVDCAACLSIATQSYLRESDPEDAEMVQTIVDALEDAGPEGLAKEELHVSLRQFYRVEEAYSGSRKL